MRDIKFRAWDTVLGFFTDQAGYFVEFDGTAWFNLGTTGRADDHLVDQSAKLILEQFTGLHDKNGKEIYEGDRIRADGMTYAVEFKEGSFIYGDTCYPASPWRVVENCEIIGNIHENPELLEELV